MPVAYYKCTKCQRTFDRYEEAVACEDGHLVPVEVRVVSYTSVKPFPFSVEVAFSNGEKRIYNSADLGG